MIYCNKEGKCKYKKENEKHPYCGDCSCEYKCWCMYQEIIEDDEQ